MAKKKSAKGKKTVSLKDMPAKPKGGAGSAAVKGGFAKVKVEYVDR